MAYIYQLIENAIGKRALSVFLFVLGLMMVISFVNQLRGRAKGKAFAALIWGIFFSAVGAVTYPDSRPFAHEQSVLEDYGQKLAKTVLDFSSSDITSCRMKSAEVYQRDERGHPRIYGKIHLEIDDFRDVKIDIPVKAVWDPQKHEWGSQAEQNIRLITLSKEFDRTMRLQEMIRSLRQELSSPSSSDTP